MKLMNCQMFLSALALAGLAAWAPRAAGQAVLNPVIVQGTVEFNNVNPVILDALTNTSSSMQTYALAVYANALPPADPTQTSEAVYADGLVIPYTLVVDAGMAGVAYEIEPIWDTGPTTGERYYFTPQDTAVLLPGDAPVTLNFNECAGVLDLHFLADGGVPVAIQGLQATVQRVSDQTTVADSEYGVSEGGSVTNKLLLVPGGGPYAITVTYQTGTNNYVDTLRYTTVITNTALCDQVVEVDVLVPSGPQLATAMGNVDLPGEFLLTVPDWPLTGNPDDPGKTVVLANYGPFYNQRWAAVRGTNFTQSASGAFVLSNLVPTDVVSPEYGYVVQAEMSLRTNRDYAFFVTPGLGWGANPGLLLAPGTNADLGNLFVIQPGYLQAPVLLKGPAETVGETNALRSLVFAADTQDPFGFGLPNGAIIYGIYGTYAQMSGADDLAPGATFAASGGASSSGGPGAFNPVTASYEGQVTLPLGGLSSQPSQWKRGLFNYEIEATPDDPLGLVEMDATVYLQDTNEVTIHAGDTVSNLLEFSFGLSEVRLSIFSSGSQFRNPRLNDYTAGQFSGTNFLGQADSYRVSVSYAYGTPAADFTNQGLVVVYLPQGTYTLDPVVDSLDADGTTSTTALQPVSLTVGVGQRISLQSDLQVQLNAPACAGGPQVPLSGQVMGSNAIASVTVTVDGGAPTTLCTDCGVNPIFNTTVAVTAVECADTTVTVTAVDQSGRTASTTSTIRYDTVPPVITCPGDITVGCAGPDGAVVNFSVTATDDCSGPVTIVCTPPSGSVFPAGTTPVQCVATDACGNSSQCSFNVTVTGSDLAIRPAIQLTWQCGGVLQSAPTPLGPWSDMVGATSPYYTTVSAQQQYFRIRN